MPLWLNKISVVQELDTTKQQQINMLIFFGSLYKALLFQRDWKNFDIRANLR